MRLFKVIDIDIEAEKKRIADCKGYTVRQRKALMLLMGLFEAGKWQECLDHINNPSAFPYNEKFEYPETEHIGIEVGKVLRMLCFETLFTREQLLIECRETIAKEAPDVSSVGYKPQPQSYKGLYCAYLKQGSEILRQGIALTKLTHPMQNFHLYKYLTGRELNNVDECEQALVKWYLESYEAESVDEH